MTTTLEHLGDKLRVEELPNGRRRIEVVASDSDTFMLTDSLETSYPIELIELMLRVNGAAGVCHEIMRDEDPHCVERLLRNDLLAYFRTDEFAGKTILDFGCGAGASTLILARMFPQSKIVGVEMVGSLLEVAEKRKQFYGLANLEFVQSPSEDKLPGNVGTFDFVILSAVYEHLLAEERKKLMPQLWAAVSDGGYLFINQTPNILFPFELHTTMLPLINYMPDKIAFSFAHRFSRRVSPTDSWEYLLRQGIRGATEREIIANLSQKGYSPRMLEPVHYGLKDRIDLYYKNTGPRFQALKSAAKYCLKSFRFVTGLTIVPDLSLAFKKGKASEALRAD